MVALAGLEKLMASLAVVQAPRHVARRGTRWSGQVRVDEQQRETRAPPRQARPCAWAPGCLSKRAGSTRNAGRASGWEEVDRPSA
eukprot:15407360-Alexandrium_andersonii.AAC.1